MARVRGGASAYTVIVADLGICVDTCADLGCVKANKNECPLDQVNESECNRALLKENQCLKREVELLKKKKSKCVFCERVQVRYAFMEAQRCDDSWLFLVEMMARV